MPSLLTPRTTCLPREGDPALAELGCPSLQEQADQQFVPYSSGLDGIGKVMLSILRGGSYLEVTVPWACRVLHKGHGSRLEGPSGGRCWPPGQAEQGEPVAGVVGRQHRALQRGGMDEQGWKHPSSLVFVEVWLF